MPRHDKNPAGRAAEGGVPNDSGSIYFRVLQGISEGRHDTNLADRAAEGGIPNDSGSIYFRDLYLFSRDLRGNRLIETLFPGGNC